MKVRAARSTLGALAEDGKRASMSACRPRNCLISHLLLPPFHPPLRPSLVPLFNNPARVV